jgi:hypothetical protein
MFFVDFCRDRPSKLPSRLKINGRRKLKDKEEGLILYTMSRTPIKRAIFRTKEKRDANTIPMKSP